MSEDTLNMPLLKEARQTVEDQLGGVSDHAHAVYVGETEDGSGKGAVIVEVMQKLTAQQMKARTDTNEVGSSVTIQGQVIPTRIVEAPMAADRRLRLDDSEAVARTLANAQNRHQGCFDCPIPGGAQMAPEGANWVGTIGAAFVFPDGRGGEIHGALTNYHVAVKANARPGDRMLQPGGRGEYFSQLHSWAQIDFGRGARNLVDLALLDCTRTDGKYAPHTDTVGPSQVEIGRYNPQPELNPRIGQQVIKSGRTTGVTRGQIVGLNSTTRVNYGEGTATFVDQIILKNNQGRDMSAGGDSGSLILTDDMRPLCLLFAGGGGTTIANPIGYVLDWSKGRFFGG